MKKLASIFRFVALFLVSFRMPTRIFSFGIVFLFRFRVPFSCLDFLFSCVVC